MIIRTAFLIGVLTLTSNANAALYDRGGGLIYDDVLNITWLQDVNYSVTQWNMSYGNQGGDVNGIMNWDDAKNWAASLTYFDAVRNVTWDDWRLPTTDSSCSGYGCVGSELGHLFYVDLGGMAEQPITTTHNANYDLFTNWQQYWASGEAIYYWTSTPYTGPSGNNAWAFSFKYGAQGPLFIGEEQHAWAVRVGDVAAIPEPANYAFMLSGLLLIGFANHSPKAKSEK